MTITADHVVEFDYTLTNDKGEVLDTSRGEGRRPLAYLHGKNNIIPGLEKHLEGKKEGDQFNATIAPEEAYGERTDDRVTTVPRAELAQIPDLQAGMQLQAQTPQGTQVVTVTEVNDDTVTLDANHPLAGETLNFDIEVVAVRKATDEEVAHGHAHGPEGHEH